MGMYLDVQACRLTGSYCVIFGMLKTVRSIHIDQKHPKQIIIITVDFIVVLC